MSEKSLPPLPVLTKWFGDGEYDFKLPIGMLSAIQTKTGQTIGVIYKNALIKNNDPVALIEVVRHGLMGGGMAGKDAGTLISSYAVHIGGTALEELVEQILENYMRGYVPETGGADTEGKPMTTEAGST